MRQQPHDFFGRLAVESAGWFVGQQQARIVDQRARDGDALLLPARQLPRMMIEPVAKPDLLKPLPGLRFRVIGRWMA